MEDKEEVFWQEYKYGKSLRICHTGYGDTHTVTRIDYDTEYDTEGQITGREIYIVSGPYALAKANETFKEWVAEELDLEVN